MKQIGISLVIGLVVGLGIGFWQGKEAGLRGTGPVAPGTVVATPPPADMSKAPTATKPAASAPAPQLLPGQSVKPPQGPSNPPK